jgi:acetyl-CoA C-acetyltransferase
MSQDSVVIIDGARTPMGSLNGVLSPVGAVDLGVTAIKAAVERAGVPNDAIDEVFMGNVLQAGVKQGPARLATIQAGISQSAGSVTLNKLCGSGMNAVTFGYDQIKLGHANVVVAGGMESMTNAPHMILGARSGVGTGAKTLEDHMFYDALWSPYSERLMGCYAQDVADELGFTREDMDGYAVESLTRAKNAIEDGTLAEEVVPVAIKTRKGESIVEHDEQPMTAKVEKIPHLKPSFRSDGTVTPANSSSISDGASALVMMSGAEAEKRGLTPMVKVVAHSRFSQDPRYFTLSPVGAIEKVLDKAGWSLGDVDLFELNEAFAMVPMGAMKKLGIPHEKLNIYGGACAQGHPVGSSGCRIIVTLMYAMRRLGKKRGVAAICIGGGEALATAIELV